MPTFVFIPGAGTDPRVWGLTIAELERLGHRGLAPPLPLADPAAHPSDHAAAVLHGIPEDAGDLVVVAQSLGAFAGPLVAESTGAQALVLVAPMIPAPGETAGEWWSNTRHGEAIAELTARRGPMAEWDETVLDEVFLHDVDPQVARDHEQYAGAPGPGMFTEPWPLPAWPQFSTIVLAPREDRLFPLEFQRRVTHERLGQAVTEMPGGHLPMLARPAELAALLVGLD